MKTSLICHEVSPASKMNKVQVASLRDPSLNIPIFEPISYGPKPVHENIDLMFLKAQVDLFNIVEYAWANSTYLNTKNDVEYAPPSILAPCFRSAQTRNLQYNQWGANEPSQ
ncbi:unnamed protein product [Bemisia tabaci]|uniref:Uncharacterized protein n=1 Tax=Bemisia tabaci TaxID=7038 RepID=A0A9P0A5H2_BEMTA|nr:unnamed protein product [Bemisia tabaci]